MEPRVLLTLTSLLTVALAGCTSAPETYELSVHNDDNDQWVNASLGFDGLTVCRGDLSDKGFGAILACDTDIIVDGEDHIFYADYKAADGSTDSLRLTLDVQQVYFTYTPLGLKYFTNEDL